MWGGKRATATATHSLKPFFNGHMLGCVHLRVRTSSNNFCFSTFVLRVFQSVQKCRTTKVRSGGGQQHPFDTFYCLAFIPINITPCSSNPRDLRQIISSDQKLLSIWKVAETTGRQEIKELNNFLLHITRTMEYQ